MQRRLAVLERERHRAIGRAHRDARAPGELGERLLERLGGPEGGAHQKKLGALEDEKGNLPGDAALLVGVVVKLVHHDAVDASLLSFTKRDVREDLGGAADDVGVAVHRGVAGDEAHAVGAEVAAEGEELLADERLDGRGVVAPLALAHGEEVQRQGDERLPAPGRGGENDVVAGKELEDGLLLGGIELEPQLGDVPEEEIEEFFGRCPGAGRDTIGKRHRPLP